MASKNFRKLVDDDGKEYVFSCEKFNNAISKYQNKLQVQNKCKEMPRDAHMSWDPHLPPSRMQR